MRLFVALLGFFVVVLAAPSLSGQLGRLIKNDDFKMPPPGELVFGGHKAYQGVFPFYVYVLLYMEIGSSPCGGSLLTPRHVLTAAHCNMQPFTNESIVIMGLDNIKKDPSKTPGVQQKKVVSIVKHKDFGKPRSFSNDIAILTLAEPFDLTNYVQLINIPIDDSELQKQYWATVCGFGTYKFDGNSVVHSDHLLYAYIPLIDFDKCFKRWPINDKTEICAGSNGTGAGPGDSGGPLFMPRGGKNWQIGLVSYASGALAEITNQADNPAIYTRLSFHCQWLNENTDGQFKCGNAK